jgi:hypothetical protein
MRHKCQRCRKLSIRRGPVDASIPYLTMCNSLWHDKGPNGFYLAGQGVLYPMQHCRPVSVSGGLRSYEDTRRYPPTFLHLQRQTTLQREQKPEAVLIKQIFELCARNSQRDMASREHHQRQKCSAPCNLTQAQQHDVRELMTNTKVLSKLSW